MPETQTLTPEQQKEIESLTPAEAQQIMTIVGSDGKISDANLEGVSGGISDRAKKIAGWGGAAIAALAIVATGVHLNKKTKVKQPEEQGTELQEIRRAAPPPKKQQ